eukprot:3293184-Prymnesium_polylepis.1
MQCPAAQGSEVSGRDRRDNCASRTRRAGDGARLELGARPSPSRGGGRSASRAGCELGRGRGPATRDDDTHPLTN